jgi:hypothetical protein
MKQKVNSNNTFNMKLKILLLWLICSPLISWGQYYSNSSSVSLNIYANIFAENSETELLNLNTSQKTESTESSQHLRIGRFSPALSFFHPNGHFSEIELSFLNFDKEDHVRIAGLSNPYPGTTQSFSLGIRYAFNFNLMAGQNSAVQPHIGLSALPFVETNNQRPKINSFYSTFQTDLGLLGQVIPRLVFELTDYLILDINAPVTIMDARRHSIRLQGGGRNLPGIAEGEDELRWLPSAIHLRLGLGVVF